MICREFCSFSKDAKRAKELMKKQRSYSQKYSATFYGPECIATEWIRLQVYCSNQGAVYSRFVWLSAPGRVSGELYDCMTVVRRWNMSTRRADRARTGRRELMSSFSGDDDDDCRTVMRILGWVAVRRLVYTAGLVCLARPLLQLPQSTKRMHVTLRHSIHYSSCHLHRRQTRNSYFVV